MTSDDEFVGPHLARQNIMTKHWHTFKVFVSRWAANFKFEVFSLTCLCIKIHRIFVLIFYNIERKNAYYSIDLIYTTYDLGYQINST